MFLEKPDLGITEFTGSSTKAQSDETIIRKLGVGIISFKGVDDKDEETPPDIVIPKYTYRVNTEVYTSLSGLNTSRVITGNSRDGYNISPTQVTFRISDTSDGAKILSQKKEAYKSDDLVYVKWKTPSKPKNITITASIKYLGTEVNSKGDTVDVWLTEDIEIPITVEEIYENTPPNPVANDRNNSFSFVSADTINSITPCTTQSWKEYDLSTDLIVNDKSSKEVLLWTTKEYTVEMEVTPYIYPDTETKTAYWDNSISSYSMKSGYGIRQKTVTKIKTTVKITEQYVDGGSVEERVITEEDKEVIGTPAQSGVSFFSDFYYKDYFRILDYNDGENDRQGILSFRNNRFSTYNNPTHFTPIWYPDNEYYTVYSYVFDSWTPSGQMYDTCWDSVYILGNMWDDWYVQRLKE